jgi:hypothetical protein
MSAALHERHVQPGQPSLIAKRKNSLAANYAKNAKTTTTGDINDEETNSAKTTKNTFLFAVFASGLFFVVSFHQSFFRVIRVIRG